MKLNLDYYKEDIVYNKSVSKDLENTLLNKIKELEGTNYDFINKENNCIAFNNITPIRKNILEWYDFKETNDVLEIGMEYGIITEFLCEKFNNVVSIDFCKSRASVIADKLKNRQNLSIFVGNLKDIKLNKKFDYIVMLGMLENYKLIFGDNIDEYILYLKSLLKDNGTILLATNNKLGVKYLAGAINEYTAKTLNDYQEKKNIENFSKKELIEILNRNNLKNYNFYYPLPDYKITNVIFSDDYLPTFNNSKLMYNLNYVEGSNIIFNELNLIKELTKSNNFSDFTNSFFVEIFKDGNYFNDNSVRFVSYNNLRKKEYRLVTKMYKDVVIKNIQCKDARGHLNTVKNNINILNECNLSTLDYFDENNIFSKYCNFKTFNRILIENIRNNNKEIVYDLINSWNNNVLKKLGVVDNYNEIINNNIFKKFNIILKEEQLNKLTFTKNGFFDLVFENAFIDEKENFVFYDQEWYEENVPIEFILYRSINNLYMYSFDINEIISKEEILKFFNRYEYIELFDKSEKSIQNKILDSNMIKISSKVYNFKVNIAEQKEAIVSLNNDRTILNNRIKELEIYTDELTNIIKQLSQENENVNLTLNNIYNSRGWKMLEKVRKIVRKK